MFFFWDGLCPNTTNPCECGYLCGWDSESQSCRYGEETSCAECEHVCEFGDCFTFDDVCPTEYNPFLECQCDVDCHLHDDCCHNERLCPGGIFFINTYVFNLERRNSKGRSG